MKIIYLIFILSASFAVNAQKPVVYIQLNPNPKGKNIVGIITETYTTQRGGTSFYWFRVGNDTLVNVWSKHLDTTRMKVGQKLIFKSVKKLVGNLWMKEKSEEVVKP